VLQPSSLVEPAKRGGKGNICPSHKDLKYRILLIVMIVGAGKVCQTVQTKHIFPPYKMGVAPCTQTWIEQRNKVIEQGHYVKYFGCVFDLDTMFYKFTK
jgi:hypothetical protein